MSLFSSNRVTANHAAGTPLGGSVPCRAIAFSFPWTDASPAAGRAGRRGPARHGHRGGHPRQGHAGRREHPGQRRHGLGGRRGGPGRGRRLGPAAGAQRSSPHRPDLRIRGQDRVFAVGDLAVTGDQPLPQLAQPALQMGAHAARQIRRLQASQPTVPFRYRDKGAMATIGYRSAVVQLPGRVRVRGTLAWLAWLALHLATLLGGRNRISALVNLSWRYLTWRRGGGLILGDDR